MQSAIGSVAAAAEQAFNPYAGRVLELMKFFMVLTNDEDLRSRARSTELVGIVAMSVGRKGMEAILPPFIDAAISVIALLFCIFELKISFCGRKSSQLTKFQGFGLEFSELREYTHGFFSNIAEILDDTFAQVCMNFYQVGFIKVSILVVMFKLTEKHCFAVFASRYATSICFVQS